MITITAQPGMARLPGQMFCLRKHKLWVAVLVLFNFRANLIFTRLRQIRQGEFNEN